jgi:hypothetical protein
MGLFIQPRLGFGSRGVGVIRALVTDARVSEANGFAERATAIEMLKELSGPVRCTVGADKAYDTRGFVAQARELNVTAHIAQNIDRSGGSAIDARTTRRLYHLARRAKDRGQRRHPMAQFPTQPRQHRNMLISCCGIWV